MVRYREPLWSCRRLPMIYGRSGAAFCRSPVQLCLPVCALRQSLRARLGKKTTRCATAAASEIREGMDAFCSVPSWVALPA